MGINLEKIDKLKNIQMEELEMLNEMNRICIEEGLKYHIAYGTALGAVRHKGFIPWDLDVDIIVAIDQYKEFCNILKRRMADKYFVYSIQNYSNYEYLFSRIGLRGQGHKNIHIDVFPMVGGPRNELGKKMFSQIAYLNFRAYYFKKANGKANHPNSMKRQMQFIFAKTVLFPIPAEFFLWVFNKMSHLYSIENSKFIYNICGSYKSKEYIPKDWLLETELINFEGTMLPVTKKWDDYLKHFYGDYMIPKKVDFI